MALCWNQMLWFSQFFFFELSFYSIQAERLKNLTILAVLLIRFLLLD